MADNNKRKFLKMTSPKGTFLWPKLSAPDYGTAEYPNPDGAYSVKLVLQADDPATQAFIAKLKPLHEKAKANGQEAFSKLKPESRKRLGRVSFMDFYTERLDADTAEPTGELVFNFKMKAGGTTNKGKKWSTKPAIFDARGVLMTKVPEIWNGTIGKVAFEVDPEGYFIPGTGAAGISLRLTGAQIIELRSGGPGKASDFGFEEEEGYAYEENNFASMGDDSEDADDASTNDDDEDF